MAEEQTPVSSKTSSKADLLSAAQAAVSDVEERSGRRSRRANSRLGRIVLASFGGLALGGAVYILTSQPDWFFTPDPAPPSVEVQDASIRLMLVREAERVRRFKVENGQLPDSLAETGAVVMGMRYARSDDSTFRLSFALGTGEIALRSNASTEEFLGNSLEVINKRGE